MIILTQNDISSLNKNSPYNYIKCPSCKSQEVKKISEGNIYRKYQCRNQNADCEGMIFAVMSNSLNHHHARKCDSCGSQLQKRINDAGSLVLSFRCGNKECPNFDIPLFYDLKSSHFIDLPISTKEKAFHYIIWWLNHNPFQEDLDVIQQFVSSEGFDIATHTKNKLSFDYRKIIIGKVDIHMKATQKYYGFGIYMHIDLSEHGRTIFTKDTMVLLSKLYLFIKENGNGRAFILPRQSSALTNYITQVRTP
ncbi:MAG: hypothetical protein EU547_03850 [Promethearchaeota archaeon]|nr:MAG: hypothetical protein EU547_03850 [Candidatus Lokiarchaeota archaeon]